MATPVVIYAAKSTQDKHKSIPTQLEDCRGKSADEDWEVVGEFSDEGFSAYTGNRGPDLERARSTAAAVAKERGEPCMLLVQAADRFARGAGDRPGAAEALVEIWHAMRRQDVHLRSVEDDFDLRDSASVANLGHRAMMESKRKSGAVAKGMKRRREKGLPQGGKRRLGYRFEKGEGRLIPVPAERPIIVRIYEEFMAGRSDEAIARDLIEEGVPTAEGGRWYSSTVREILINPLYKGWMATKDGVVKGQHEGLVSEERWEQAQDLRRQRAVSSPGKGRGRRSSGKHLFRKGMLRCGCCGGAMVARTTRPGKSRPGRKVAETYICLERKRHPDLCPMTPVKRSEVDIAVFNYFEAVALDVEATRAQVAEAQDRKLFEVRALSEQAQAEQQRAEERLARVRRDYADDRISAEDWVGFRDELTDDLEGARAEVARLAAQATEVEHWAALKDAEQRTLEKLAALRAAVAGEVNAAGDLDAVRASLTRLFDHFVIRVVQPGMRLHAELAWVGGLILEPVVREEAIEGHAGVRPVFRREPVYDPGASIQGSPRPLLNSSALFGPIPVTPVFAHAEPKSKDH